MTSQFTLSQRRVLAAIKMEFIKLNNYSSDYSEVMEPLSEEVYASLPEYEDHPSEYYEKLIGKFLNE